MVKTTSGAVAAQRETAWRNRLLRFAAGKQTVTAFCQREAVSVGAFYGWQARFRVRDAGGESASKKPPALSPSPFLDLGTVSRIASNVAIPAHAHNHAYAPAPAHAQPKLDIRLDLGGGMALTIARH